MRDKAEHRHSFHLVCVRGPDYWPDIVYDCAGLLLLRCFCCCYCHQLKSPPVPRAAPSPHRARSSPAMMHHLLFVLLSLALLACAQDSGYIGYSLTQDGDPDSAVYETADTQANVSTTVPPPDVFLNASLHVGEIDIEVDNLTAKVNLDAQVLNLLQFNAGVDASINRVYLTIQNVTAKVILEARLSNLLLMVEDVLDSLDLNPIIATLGNDVGQIVNTTVGGLTGSSSSSGGVSARDDPMSYNIEHNILYSVNDYSGNTHTNRMLAQDGAIIDQSLDNDGTVQGQKVVGSYDRDMHYTGYNVSAERDGQQVRELGYEYRPFPGLEVFSAVFVDDAGSVVGTQVLAEASAGGSSTISADE